MLSTSPHSCSMKCQHTFPATPQSIRGWAVLLHFQAQLGSLYFVCVIDVDVERVLLTWRQRKICQVLPITLEVDDPIHVSTYTTRPVGEVVLLCHIHSFTILEYIVEVVY